jgi:hypothetical protein
VRQERRDPPLARPWVNSPTAGTLPPCANPRVPPHFPLNPSQFITIWYSEPGSSPAPTNTHPPTLARATASAMAGLDFDTVAQLVTDLSQQTEQLLARLHSTGCGGQDGAFAPAVHHRRCLYGPAARRPSPPRRLCSRATCQSMSRWPPLPPSPKPNRSKKEK